MLLALMDFPYAGRTVRRGEQFAAVSLEDQRVLILAQRACLAEDVNAAVESANTVTLTSTALDAKRYKRRDLRAER